MEEKEELEPIIISNHLPDIFAALLQIEEDYKIKLNKNITPSSIINISINENLLQEQKIVQQCNEWINNFINTINIELIMEALSKLMNVLGSPISIKKSCGKLLSNILITRPFGLQMIISRMFSSINKNNEGFFYKFKIF